MTTTRKDRIKKLADIGDIFQSIGDKVHEYGSDIAGLFTKKNLDEPEPTPTLQPSPVIPSEQSNMAGAIAYNTRAETAFKSNAERIKQNLSTTADWKSLQFAQAVYNWQKHNGLDGKWVDGKFGPLTMSVMVKTDPALKNDYDPYSTWKMKHINDVPSNHVQNLAPEVDKIRKEMGATNIPLNLLLGWMQVESAGNLNSRGLASLDERGLFQISKDESNAINVDHNRVGTDIDYSIRSGIELAKYRANQIDKILSRYPNMIQTFTKDSDMYWRLVFFAFSAGEGSAELLVSRMSNSGISFSNWNDVMEFAASNQYGFKHSPVKWSYHVNRAFDLGNRLNSSISSSKTAEKIKILNLNKSLRIDKVRKTARTIVLTK